MIIIFLLFLFTLFMVDLTILVSLMENTLPSGFTEFECWMCGGLTLATVLFFVVRYCFRVKCYRIVQIDTLLSDCSEYTKYNIQYYNKFLWFKWWLYCYNNVGMERLWYGSKAYADNHIRYLLSEKKTIKEIHPPTM